MGTTPLKTDPFVIRLLSEEETNHCASIFAHCCRVPCVVYLRGELGAGKTSFVRGWLRSLGYSDRVKSPTYTLVESYEFGETCIHHFDLYRLQHPSELIQLGMDDYLNSMSLCLIEWPEKGGSEMPTADLICQFEYENETARKLGVVALTTLGETVLTQIIKAIQ